MSPTSGSLLRRLEDAARALADASRAIREAVDELRSGGGGERDRDRDRDRDRERPQRERGEFRAFEPSNDDRPHTNDPIERWPGLPAAAMSAATEALSLVQDIDHILPALNDLSPWERSATVATLAGRGRKVQSRLNQFGRDLPPSLWADLRVFFGKLTTFTKRVHCEWIEALSTTWNTDWDLYVRYHSQRLEEGRGGTAEAPLSRDDHGRVLRDRLRAIIGTRYPDGDAQRVLEEARQVLPGDDSLLTQALRTMGISTDDGRGDGEQPPTERPVKAPPREPEEEPGDNIGNVDPQSRPRVRRAPRRRVPT